MKLYDVSVTIHPGMVIYPGNPGVDLERVQDIEHGDSANVSRLTLGVHTGTHVDAPVHFIPGASGAAALDLQVLMGPALVVHALHADAIDARTLDSLAVPPGTERLLVRTRNSDLWARDVTTFDKDFVAVTGDGARWLVDRGIRLVGVDYLSVGPFGRGKETHEVLLGAGIIPLEGLDLSAVPPGGYQLFCLPLKIAGSDGAPARVVLIAIV